MNSNDFSIKCELEKTKINQSGQALVVVLLSLAVVLTLVLFILSRSITDVAVSSKDEEAVRAFSAAEAGIERALVIGVGNNSPTGVGDANFTSSVTSFAEASPTFNYPLDLAGGDTATTWFTAHDTDNSTICDATHTCFTGTSMQVCWGKPGTLSTDATTPAVEVSVFYESTPGDLTTIKIGRGVYDPYAARLASNKFSASDNGACIIGDVSYAFGKTITFSSLGIPAGSYNSADGLQFAKIRMLYNNTDTQPFGVSVGSGNLSLPSQGIEVVSTGVAGDSNRRLNVFQGFPEPPSIFGYALFSSSGLTKGN